MAAAGDPIRGITVTSPNGGERIEMNSTQTVTWTSFGLDANTTLNIVINTSPYSFVGGMVIGTASGSDTSYSWNVGTTPKGNYYLWVYDIVSLASDRSNATFALLPGAALGETITASDTVAAKDIYVYRSDKDNTDNILITETFRDSPPVRWKHFKVPEDVITPEDLFRYTLSVSKEFDEAIGVKDAFSRDTREWRKDNPLPDGITLEELMTRDKRKWRHDEPMSELLTISDLSTPKVSLWMYQRAPEEDITMSQAFNESTTQLATSDGFDVLTSAAKNVYSKVMGEYRTWKHKQPLDESLSLTDAVHASIVAALHGKLIDAMSMVDALNSSYVQLRTSDDRVIDGSSTINDVQILTSGGDTLRTVLGQEMKSQRTVVADFYTYTVGEIVKYIQALFAQAHGETVTVSDVFSSALSKKSMIYKLGGTGESTSTLYRSGMFNIGDLRKNKILRRLNVDYDSADPVTFKVYANGNDKESWSTTLPATTKATHKSIRIGRRAKFFELELSTPSSTNYDTTIEKLEVEYH